MTDEKAAGECAREDEDEECDRFVSRVHDDVVKRKRKRSLVSVWSSEVVEEEFAVLLGEVGQF